MENCVFCKMVQGEIKPVIVWENDSYFAFLDQNPIQHGHTLVVPKKHTDYIFDLENPEYTELLLHAKDISHTLKAKLNPKRVGMVVEGFGVAHVHVHLIPINNMNELSPLERKSANEDELKEIAGIILGNQ